MQTPPTLRSSDVPCVDPEPTWSAVSDGRAVEAAGPVENRQTAAGFPPVLGRAARAHSYHSPQRRVIPTTEHNPGRPDIPEPGAPRGRRGSLTRAGTGNSSCRAPARIVDAGQRREVLDCHPRLLRGDRTRLRSEMVASNFDRCLDNRSHVERLPLGVHTQGWDIWASRSDDIGGLSKCPHSD
jgi:hypothetical protein